MTSSYKLPMNAVKEIDNLIPDMPYSELKCNTTIGVNELDGLRQRLQQNIGFINLRKQCIRHQEYTQLMNYHQYALNVLNNMINIKKVEYNNPYNQNMRKYLMGDKVTPFEGENDGHNMAIYDDKGRIQTLNCNELRRTEEWETQFDQNIINPPCYMLPPSNCFNPKTKKGEHPK